MIALLAMMLTRVLGASPPSQAALTAAADYSRDDRGMTFLVLYDGKIIFERYDNRGSVDREQMLASGSKSFVGLAAAAAVQDGLLHFDDFASNGIAEWKGNSVKEKITFRQLLSMTSGLTPGEQGNARSTPSWADIAAVPMMAKPGARFQYGAYHINSAANYIEKKLKGETFEAYLQRRVLGPIGAKIDWRWRCADGHPQVAGGAFMTAREWAKVGVLVCQHGMWNGKEILDPAILGQLFEGTSQNPTYGYTWWLKKPIEDALARTIPLVNKGWGAVGNSKALPDDLVAACGAGNQRMYVIPSRKLVIVRQGTLTLDFSDMKLLTLALNSP